MSVPPKVLPLFHKKDSLIESEIKKTARQNRLNNLIRELAGKSELIDFLEALPKDRVDYLEYRDAVNCVSHAEFSQLMSKASLFGRLPRDEEGRVSVEIIFRLACTLIERRARVLSLEWFSECGEWVGISELQDWLYFVSGNLIQIKKMPERYIALWVMTAARTIVTFTGNSRGRVKVSDLFESKHRELMCQLWDLNDLVQVKDCETSFFSRLKAVRYYESYAIFDVTSGSLENPFGGGYLNPKFTERLVDFYGGRLSFDEYLTVAIAWENRHTQAGVKFFWKLLDVHNKGILTANDLFPFAQGIVAVMANLPHLYEGRATLPSPDLLSSEIIDIVPRSAGKSLTYKDAIESSASFGLLLGVLCNSESCFEYESRDENAQQRVMQKNCVELKQKMVETNRVVCGDALTNMKSTLEKVWLCDTLQAIREARGKFDAFVLANEELYGGLPMEPALSMYYEWESNEQLQQELLIRRLIEGNVTSDDNGLAARE